MQFKFTNLTDLLTTFNTEEKCRAYLEQQRWKGKITCPHCGSEKVYRTNRGFKCIPENKGGCDKKFSVTVGTLFEKTYIPLQKWFAAMYLFTAHKKGVSSCQLARDIGVTQKTAWFMLHRIREMFSDKDAPKLSGEIEIDEMNIGGSETNMHKSVKARKGYSPMTQNRPKAKVMGIISRGAGVRLFKLPNLKNSTAHPIIVNNIEHGSKVFTDESKLYNGVRFVFEHKTVNHSRKQYVRGNAHTNSIEGMFSQMKRGIYGIYHQVSEKHLQSYCNEFAYRHNTRETTDAYRLEKTFRITEWKLTYAQLIAR